MDKIREYKPYKGITIFRDFNIVDGEQVYIGNGQGCGTFWFKNVKDAHRFIDKYRNEMDVTPLGAVSLIPGEICKRCKSYYSFGTKEWEKAIDYACKDYKEKLKKKIMEEKDGVKKD